MVGIQKNIHVVDVTSAVKKAPTDGSAPTSGNKEAHDGVHKLPAGLTQEELHVPSDEKDVYAYYYINKVRTHCSYGGLSPCISIHLNGVFSPVNSSLDARWSL